VAEKPADPLRPFWDFDDLDASEQRFRRLLGQVTTDEARAEVLTQLARVEGLRGRFDEGERLLQTAEALADGSKLAAARIQLERGRLYRSSGDEPGARPLFESAFALSLEAGEHAHAADAAHMAALVAPDRAAMVVWTQRGVEIAANSQHGQVRHWLGPLLNNLGWAYYETGDYELALEAFQDALTAREEYPEERAEIEIARYAVGKTLRALGRPGEAVAQLEQAVSWAQSEGEPDGWFHEELAEEYAALGRHGEAREHARLALSLLWEADESFAGDSERVDRLDELARQA
jgi:tetratricopeptide (TPR) repeat protein